MNQAFLRSFLSVAVVLMALLSGCKKDEIIIDDNTAPPDSTISTLVLENYVNKCYISLLGREPMEQEADDALAALRSGNMDVASRNAMLEEIIDNSEYRTKVLEYNTQKLLNSGFDTTDIQLLIYVHSDLLDDPQYAPFYDFIVETIANLQLLLDTPEDFENGTIDMIEMHRRLVTNDIYDQINMGSFNFVLSMFNNFLFRDPTVDEHNAGITMVDDFVAVIFYETGNSKEQFIDIFLHSDDYYEGQVRELFSRYLFRDPTSAEQAYHSVRYKESGDYERLQKDILSLDEFAGL